MHPIVPTAILLHAAMGRYFHSSEFSQSYLPHEVHAFRHSAASLINHKTGNLKLAQGLLGHSNLSTTADTYTHTSAEAQREASEVLERKILGDLFPIVPKTGNRSNSFVN